MPRRLTTRVYFEDEFVSSTQYTLQRKYRELAKDFFPKAVLSGRIKIHFANKWGAIMYVQATNQLLDGYYIGSTDHKRRSHKITKN